MRPVSVISAVNHLPADAVDKVLAKFHERRSADIGENTCFSTVGLLLLAFLISVIS